MMPAVANQAANLKGYQKTYTVVVYMNHKNGCTGNDLPKGPVMVLTFQCKQQFSNRTSELLNSSEIIPGIGNLAIYMAKRLSIPVNLLDQNNS